MIKTAKKQIKEIQMVLKIRIEFWKSMSKSVEEFQKKLERYKQKKEK